MLKLTYRIAMASCVTLAGVAGAASNAWASSAIYGGGSSMLAPAWRQISDCYGTDIDLLFQDSSGYPLVADTIDFNYPGPTGAQNCATTHIAPTLSDNYISTGSGIGIDGFYSHEPKLLASTARNIIRPCNTAFPMSD